MKPTQPTPKQRPVQDRGVAIGIARRWIRDSGQRRFPTGRRQAREVVRAVWKTGRMVTVAELSLLHRALLHRA